MVHLPHSRQRHVLLGEKEPTGRAGHSHLKAAQVGLQLSCQDFQRGGLPNAIGAHQAQHLPWPRHWQSASMPEVACQIGNATAMAAAQRYGALATCSCQACCLPVQFEGVGPISVGCLPLKVLRQVDDHDGIERAFLRIPATLSAYCSVHDSAGLHSPKYAAPSRRCRNRCTTPLKSMPSSSWASLLCIACLQHTLKQPYQHIAVEDRAPGASSGAARMQLTEGSVTYLHDRTALLALLPTLLWLASATGHRASLPCCAQSCAGATLCSLCRPAHLCLPRRRTMR